MVDYSWFFLHSVKEMTCFFTVFSPALVTARKMPLIILIPLLFLALVFVLYNVFFRIFIQFHRMPTPPFFGRLLKSKLRRMYRDPVKMLAPLELRSPQKVLEIGPGEGVFSVEMAGRLLPDGKLICVELQEYFLEQTEKAVEAAGLTNVDFIFGSSSDLPLENACMDAAIAVAVIPLIPDYPKTLSEVYRVLKPGGLFLVSEEVPSPEYVPPFVTKKWCERAGFTVLWKKVNIFGHTFLFRK